MTDSEARFAYEALDGGGRRRRGEVVAASLTAAHASLRAQGLSPLRLDPMLARAGRAPSRTAGKVERRKIRLADRDLAEFLGQWAALLKAGADIRSSLQILGAPGIKAAVGRFAAELNRRIAGGEDVDAALAALLGADQGFIAALAAAGQSSGDLSGGLARSAEILETRLNLRDQLVSALSYPGFVFVSAIGALGVILLFIVPALEPLAEDNGAKPALSLAILIAASAFLRGNLLLLASAATVAVAALAVAWTSNLLVRPLDRLLLQGPWRRTANGLVYGGYVLALGAMLSGGASMTEALRLSSRIIRSPSAREAVERLTIKVRQGTSLAAALGEIRGLPGSIARLATVGEVSGALGPMLARAGKLEEEQALRKIEAAGRMLGPALIVALGAMIGLLMASLLTGVSQLGESALR
jgi:type II secretory pathway component PulF